MTNQFDKYSDAEAHRVAYLIAGYIRGTLSHKENEELDDWICKNDENMQLFEKLTDEKNIEQATKWMEAIQTEQALIEKKKSIEFNKQPAKKIWKRLAPYAVAASVIIIAGLIIYKPFSPKPDIPPITDVSKDIAPGGNKAFLILSDGKKITLDSAANGKLTEEGNTVISNTNGLLEYSTGSSKSVKSIYNTVTTPRGGQYKLTLSDGTKVWLNAASSINYPVYFNVDERVVSVDGEAYFEVAKHPNQPFKVKTGDIIVEVLGTHFNINAYTDEPSIRTTLAEGSVKILNKNSSVTLTPGQEAQLSNTGEIKTITADLNEVLAWKDGKFSFTETPIENVMRQIARWYDAEIIYQTGPTDHFNAIDVPRDVPVSKLLHILELTKRVHFKIEDKTITVMK